MMETTTKEHTIRRKQGAAQVQTTGGAAGVDARCGVRSGESVVDRLPTLSLRKLAQLKARLGAGESLHISSAAGLISWRYHRRPEGCLYLVTEFYTGSFLAWLTEAEKTVLDAVLAECGKGVAAC